jgi:hypothetical protein
VSSVVHHFCSFSRISEKSDLNHGGSVPGTETPYVSPLHRLGKQALTLFAVTPGGILVDYLAEKHLENGRYSFRSANRCQIFDATELRAFWTKTK